MAQPQHQAPPQAFSPPQHSPSPATSQTSFVPPPQKRPRTDGPPSQPDSPYAQSPYAVSPVPGVMTPGSAGSPAATQSPVPIAPSAYNPPPSTHPHTNGHTIPNMSLNLPDPRPSATPPLQTPQPAPTPISAPAPLPGPTAQFTTATMAPVLTSHVPLPNQGVMGPPQRPAERATKDYEYDVTDSLAGTGIDLRAEEQYLADMYSQGYTADAWQGFAQHPSGPKSSFYGAGPANVPAEVVGDLSQEQFAAQAAEKAWADSAMRVGVQRAQEMNDAFLDVAVLHRRADKIAREHSLTLNLDLKNSGQPMGKMRQPHHFPEPKVTVRTSTGPDGSLVTTAGSFIPHEAYLADQIALLSIAMKIRLRDLMEDANAVASHRQKTSHGEIPEAWSPAAAPLNKETSAPEVVEDTQMSNAAGGDEDSLKRSAEEASLVPPAPPKKLPKVSSYLMSTMRDMAKQEREWEEARLRKRQKRKDGIADAGSGGSRAGSVAPGTPGTVAPEAEKAAPKKETKKSMAAKAAEASNHANQNMTSTLFAGLGGKGSLFGNKKKGKTYDWMNTGRGGSGANTPTRGAPGGAKGLGATGGMTASANVAMTTEGRNRLGTWREDREKGKNIQLRDWVHALERDGREGKALQKAYSDLDMSGPR